MAVTDERLCQEVTRNEHTHIMRVGSALDFQAQGCAEVQLRFVTLTETIQYRRELAVVVRQREGVARYIDSAFSTQSCCQRSWP